MDFRVLVEHLVSIIQSDEPARAMSDAHVGELFAILADIHNRTIALPEAEERLHIIAHDVAVTKRRLALHFARSAEDVHQLVVNDNADVHARDVDGRTPLARALRFHRMDVVRALLDHGATLDGVAAVPPWVREFLEARERCRQAALLLVGIRSLGRSALLSTNNRDAVDELARAVWGTRHDPAWAAQAMESPTKCHRHGTVTK